MDAEQIVEAAKRVDKALMTALQDVDWVDLDARASIITTAIAMYLRREEPNLKTIDFFAAACIYDATWLCSAASPCPYASNPNCSPDGECCQ